AHHFSGNRITPAEQALGAVQIALFKAGPDRGAGNPRTGHLHTSHRLDIESRLGRHRLQIGQVAGAPGTETEIVADQEPLHRQAARPRSLGEPRDHGAMPEMDAVEIADGERDGRVRPRRDTPKDPHTRSVKSLNFSGFCTPGARISWCLEVRRLYTVKDKCWARAQSAMAAVSTSESPIA